MSLTELIMNRRSIRKYKSEKVANRIIEQILKKIYFSVSSRDYKAWQVIVVDDKDLLEQLSVAKHGAGLLAGASHGLVVLGEPGTSDVWIEDTSILSSNILLCCQELGLGACWVQIRLREQDGRNAEDYVRRLLSIPNAYSVECIIGLGYPAEDKKPYDMKNFSADKYHYNNFDNKYKF